MRTFLFVPIPSGKTHPGTGEASNPLAEAEAAALYRRGVRSEEGASCDDGGVLVAFEDRADALAQLSNDGFDGGLGVHCL